MNASWGGNLTLGLICALAALGFVAGASSARFPQAPRIAGLAIAAGYVVLLGITAAYAAACPGCTSHISYDSTRPIDLIAAVFWGGIFTAAIVLCISAGSIASTAFRRLLR